MKKLTAGSHGISLIQITSREKLLGTIAHGQALLILAHYFIYGKGFSAVIVLFVSIALWVFAYKNCPKRRGGKMILYILATLLLSFWMSHPLHGP